MKYVIEFKEEPMEIKVPNGMSEYYPCINLPGLSLPKEDLDELTPYNREAIENEVWGLVGVIANMDNNDYGRAFGCIGRWTLLRTKTYQEVKEKYEAMEKNEICVGDEVDYFFMKGIVTRVDDDFGVNVLWKDGTYSNLTSNVVKTGKHFPEVANLLDKMRGEQE